METVVVDLIGGEENLPVEEKLGTFTEELAAAALASG